MRKQERKETVFVSRKALRTFKLERSLLLVLGLPCICKLCKMIYTADILKSLKTKKLNGSKVVLFENGDIRIVHLYTNLELECLGERSASKRDLYALAIFFRKYFLLTHNHRILILLSTEWRLDSGAWDLYYEIRIFREVQCGFCINGATSESLT